MTIQPLLHPTPPKSRFVTVVSWLSLLSGAGMTFSAASAILLIHPSLGQVAVLVGGLLAMIAGAGLNHREEWARQGFIFVQAYGIVGAIIEVARSPMRIGTLAGLVMALAVNGWIIAKLRSPGVRAEFDDSE